MADHRVGLDPVGPPQRGQRQLHARPAPAGSARYRPAARRRRAPRAARSRPAQRTPAPVRRPPRRMPARRPAVAGPSRPTANPDRSRRTRCPADARRRGGPTTPAAGSPAASARSPATAWSRSRAHTVANLGDRRAVMVEGVRHVGQPHAGAGAGHPVGEQRRAVAAIRSRRLARHHQAWSPPVPAATATGSGVGACSITTCALVPLTPNDDTPARRGRPPPATRMPSAAMVKLRRAFTRVRGELSKLRCWGM